ncbi:kinase-like domain-containing protein [Colletotrichum cereale]|nr:kinase-like domain-containing protein [Colletotrichum cereale]
MAAQYPVNESLREVDSHIWLVGERLLISRSSEASSNYLWSDGCSSYYSVAEVPGTPPASQALSTSSSDPIRLVYDAGGISAVWEIANAFLKVKVSNSPNTTREHVTLAGVKAMSPSFAIPEVLYHGEWDSRQYLILSRVPGQTLADVWPTMDEATKCRYVDRVVDICVELGEHQASRISGLDGKHLFEPLLIRGDKEEEYSHENLMKSFTEIGMDYSTSTFVFFHCDLGPGNLIIDSDGSLGIIDWEMAGFVPKEWIRTRFCISGGLDLPGTDDDERVDWRRRVGRRLSTRGYHEIADQWMAWWKSE